MISSYNITEQAVATGGLLTFTTNRILTGCTVTHAEGTTSFQLNKPGYYYVSFNGIAAPTTAAGNVTVQLLSNTSPVPGAIATFSSTATTDLGNLSFATIIKVLPSCCAIDNTTTLTLTNSGVDSTYNNVNLSITKLC